MILTAVRPGLRGELTRWMVEPQAGVFVGNLTSRIREKLWDKVVREAKDGSAILLYSARTEQGFAMRSYGDRRRLPVDFDGITLIQQRINRDNQ